MENPKECLRCGAVFDSEGPHNRICGACRTKNENNPGEMPDLSRIYDYLDEKTKESLNRLLSKSI